MAEIVQGPNENPAIDIIKMVMTGLIRYFSYLFLTFPVCLTVATLMFILVPIFRENLNFGFLSYLSIIDPIFGQKSMSLGLKEVMEVFLAFSIALTAIVEVLKFTLKKVFNTEIIMTFKKRLVVILGPVHLIFLTAFLLIPYVQVAEGVDRNGFYFVFAVFYVLTIVPASIYLALNELANRIARWGSPQ